MTEILIKHNLMIKTKKKTKTENKNKGKGRDIIK